MLSIRAVRMKVCSTFPNQCILIINMKVEITLSIIVPSEPYRAVAQHVNSLST
jgi:hypothetical protein